jgi:PilZ domain
VTIERRTENRLWCSDLIKVRAGRREIDANLEDISPSGACVQTEDPLKVGAKVSLLWGRRRWPGRVRYSLQNEIGYFAGVEFEDGRKWSPDIIKPQHMIDPAKIKSKERLQ